jgi:hypothetical protein
MARFLKRGELDAALVIAPLPSVLPERCITAPGLIAQVVGAKYCFLMPADGGRSIYAGTGGLCHKLPGNRSQVSRVNRAG